MKILNANNSYLELFKNKDHSFSGSLKKKTKASEFRKILEQTMGDQSIEDEEFRVLLPKHGHFWDNGYEDLD